MDYNVGDVIWVVLEKRPGLVVLQVSEQITKRTLAGEETIYHLIPLNATTKKETVITLDQIPGDIYKTSSEAREAMISTASQAIDNMIAEAQSVLNIKFNTPEPTPVIPEIEETFYNNEDSITLPDGTKARINIPPELKEAMT